MKERLYRLVIAMERRLKRSGWRLMRRFVNTTLSLEDSFRIPVIINNRNRKTYTEDLVNWLVKAGYSNVHILDNGSTYQPLLNYYQSTPARVHYLGANKGYMALWQTDLFREMRKGYYVYTDSDVLPQAGCPPDIVWALYKALKAHGRIEKCGAALRIDDLPGHYQKKDQVIAYESAYWQKKLDNDLFDAPVDTTFALYRPFAEGNAEMCPAARLGGPYTFVHRPWYEDTGNPDDETRFYIEHVSSSSYWYGR